MRLDEAILAGGQAQIAAPDYSRGQGVGIVHFGIGAFHRAHQAWYTDSCLRAGDADWMISGVSMRSRAVRDQLDPQDGLYTLTERFAAGQDTVVIGAVREVLVAGDSADAIVDRMASPQCRIVSFTVTEKGYCRAADGSLDLGLAAQGFYPLVGEALARRKANALPGITLLSCDNLSGNGKQLRGLMRQWLDSSAPELADWFDEQCTSPETMVDRIVPATTDDDIATLENRLGFEDGGAVFTEPFSQWVIENDFANGRPRWDSFGAQIVEDVAPYETAKLRMLNGAHSLLAYCGLDAGYEFVHQAIADERLLSFVVGLIAESIETIVPGPDQDLAQYGKDLILRFRNPALNHRLAQIAMDGSQKVPQRWLATMADRQANGLASPAICAGLTSWVAHVRGDRRKVDDPLADKLAAACASDDADKAIDDLFGAGGLVPSDWTPDAEARTAISSALA